MATNGGLVIISINLFDQCRLRIKQALLAYKHNYENLLYCRQRATQGLMENPCYN